MTKKNIKDEIEDIEAGETPVIDPVVEIKEKVDGALREKIEAMVKGFQDERERGFEELANLNQSLESLKDQKSKLVVEKEALIKGVMGWGTPGVALLDQKIQWLEKQAVGLQKQIDQLFAKLTDIPKLDFQTLNLLTNLTRKG